MAQATGRGGANRGVSEPQRPLMLRFDCMRCSRKIGVPDSYRGRRIVCPRCSGVVLVPGLPGALGEGGAAGNAMMPVLEEVAAVSGLSGGNAKPQAGAAVLARPELAKTVRVPAPETVAPGNWVDYLRASKASVLVSWLIIAFGIGWLLHALDLLPGFAWLWTIGLGVAGLLVLILGGINKQTLVAGPYLIILAGFSIIRQIGWITWEVEIPCLVIAFGLLMFGVTLGGYNLPDLLRE